MNELEQYLEQIKALERQIEDIEIHRQVDFREQNRQVNPFTREGHRMKRRLRNDPEANITDCRETVSKKTRNGGGIDGRSLANGVESRYRKSMELFDDVDSAGLDGTSNLHEEGSVNMSHPYGDLLDEKYPKNDSYEPRIVRTKETLRRKEELSGNDVHDYVNGSQQF